ncbi:MAG: hypothetical protein JWQ20_1791, partial [Conexibacter sp.]|nr:hypothetical protein [Conexibacter sp.]
MQAGAHGSVQPMLVNQTAGRLMAVAAGATLMAGCGAATSSG